MNQTMDGPLQISQHEYSDARLRPSCTDVVYVRGMRVDVPSGFQLAKGPVEPGDLYLFYPAFIKSRGTEIKFLPADRYVGTPTLNVEPENAADGFAMLIRPLAAVDENA